jgi:acetyltransferase-like isoleucine patch superfamily enzyme
MNYQQIKIDRYENETGKPAFICNGLVKLNPGARIIKSTLLGPVYLNRNSQIGPDVIVGKYFGMNESCFIARATVGNYCSFGARTSINPFNHPTDWISTNEFQYHPGSFNWVPEYNEFIRLERSKNMFSQVVIGNDVWSGHNVNILPGVHIGDGAVIGAGAVVTKNVPPYAVVTGVPATVRRYRFSEKIIERFLIIKWWNMELSELSGLPFNDVEACLSMLEEIKSVKNEKYL